MKRIAYLYGSKDGEHVRLESENESVVLISHECVPGRVQNQWRDRALIALPLEVLEAGLEAITNE